MMNEKEILQATEEIAATQRFEGLEISQEERETIGRILKGETTADEEVQRYIEEYHAMGHTNA